MRRLAIALLLLLPADGERRATARCSPRGIGICRRLRPATRTPRTVRRLATRRGVTSSRRFSRPGPSAQIVVALRADLLARGRAQVARAEALDRGDGFRSAAPLAPLPGANAGVGPRRPDAGLARRVAAAAADGQRGGRGLGARARFRTLRRLSGGLAVRGRFHGQDRRAGRGAPRRRRVPSAAAGGTTCARSASGRRTWPRTGLPAGSATARSGTGCAGSE